MYIKKISVMEFLETKRTIKVYINSKHAKSLPLYLKPALSKIKVGVFETANKNKMLSNTETAAISEIVFPVLVDCYLLLLKENEKYLWELIYRHKPVGCREVMTKSGKRYELVFSNNLKIKCDFNLYKFCNNKLEKAYLNY